MVQEQRLEALAVENLGSTLRLSLSEQEPEPRVSSVLAHLVWVIPAAVVIPGVVRVVRGFEALEIPGFVGLPEVAEIPGVVELPEVAEIPGVVGLLEAAEIPWAVWLPEVEGVLEVGRVVEAPELALG